MRQREDSRSASQRRPRLLRASVTEPSLFTSSIVKHGALDMSSPSSSNSSGGRGGGSGGGGGDSSSGSGSGSPSGSSYRRATDLLNHVAYLSSCATSPVSSFTTSALFDRVSQRRASQSTAASTTSGANCVSARRSYSRSRDRNGGSSRTGGGASGSACRRSESEDLLGSSPASTRTGGSLEDLQGHHPCSAHYYSFPSFDTWDPDGQDKEDDGDD
ncbi:hypothetical protein SPI_07368 [Niveomyces insectorum RCEF 264]|uniref:Uncharacterized protein n=1 Tax=Niveomyces insectorum RCEF 264 TaxID=1081102 RepID=A0A167PSV5_9HYPO|nr:hypothetical protein SPI_07368 [Niveomyces insectorum RCEF 264]